MSDVSANLLLPYIQPSQAQKHVTHNEGMRRLDALVQLTVEAADQAAPPVSPQDGERYILPTGATAAWAGRDGQIAVFEDTVWVFYAPQNGWIAWVRDTEEQRVFDGSTWAPVQEPPVLQNLDHIGIQTTADAANRLAVSSEATLLTHAGAGHQLKLNKAGSGDTASLLFQTGWSGRAEMGTAGSDDFEIKVSSDGSSFSQAMVADAATGKVSFPSGVDGLAPDTFGTGALLTVDYLASKGVDLVTNSTGLMGNSYNYPPEFSYDPVNTPNLPASFFFEGLFSGAVSMEELLPVDPNQIYRFSSYVRQEGLPGDWSAYTNEERHLQYMGLVCLDADKQEILSYHHMRYKHSGFDSLTTLAQPLAPGDTALQVVDASGWNEISTQSSFRGLAIFGYQSAAGFSYAHYTRHVEFDLFDLGQVNKTTNVVTLNKPLPTAMGNPQDAGGVWPAGTKIANSSSGLTYKYAFFSGLHVPEVDRWYHATNRFGGIDTSGTNYGLNFPPGTAFARPMWFPNYSNRVGGFNGYPETGVNQKVWFAGVSVTPEPLAVQSEILTGVNAGRKSLKVPVSDYAGGTISLNPPVLEIEAV